jgi:hypothetical protein
LAKVADAPRQIGLHHLVIRVRRPEALHLKFLERLTRDFKLALAWFRNWLRHVNGVEISPFSAVEQAGNS